MLSPHGHGADKGVAVNNVSDAAAVGRPSTISSALIIVGLVVTLGGPWVVFLTAGWEAQVAAWIVQGIAAVVMAIGALIRQSVSLWRRIGGAVLILAGTVLDMLFWRDFADDTTLALPLALVLLSNGLLVAGALLALGVRRWQWLLLVAVVVLDFALSVWSLHWGLFDTTIYPILQAIDLLAVVVALLVMRGTRAQS